MKRKKWQTIELVVEAEIENNRLKSKGNLNADRITKLLEEKDMANTQAIPKYIYFLLSYDEKFKQSVYSLFLLSNLAI